MFSNSLAPQKSLPLYRAGIVCSWTALAAPVLVNGYAISTMNLHAQEESVCVEADLTNNHTWRTRSAGTNLNVTTKMQIDELLPVVIMASAWAKGGSALLTKEYLQFVLCTMRRLFLWPSLHPANQIVAVADPS
jgi:hypothetical protein